MNLMFWRQESYYTLDQAALLLAEIDPWDVFEGDETRLYPPHVHYRELIGSYPEKAKRARSCHSLLLRAAQRGALELGQGRATDRAHPTSEPYLIAPEQIDPDSCDSVTFDISRLELRRWWLEHSDELPAFLADKSHLNQEAPPKNSHLVMIAWLLEALLKARNEGVDGKEKVGGRANQSTIITEMIEPNIHGLSESTIKKAFGEANQALKDARTI
tara:strand:- start:4697 stop:5344 length:648 start_codon:yes stop_codon:yes gene_type:complete